MIPNYKWSHLEDVANPLELTDRELTSLLEVWKDQRGALADEGATAEFSKRLNREWAIETGIIERAYTLDRGTTEMLINEGIKVSLITRGSTNKDPEELAAILQDHLDALEGLFAFVKGERELTTSYIKEVHSALLRHVHTHTVKDANGNLFEAELKKGEYKTQPNSPTRPDGSVHEYCPPEHVAAEMDRMIELYRSHIHKDIPPEVQAAWLHHVFTQIHPFADGNGRVARILASLVFVKAGGFPFLVRRDDHAQYIGALEAADQGDLKPLVRFFVRTQRRAVLGALQALPHIAGSTPASVHARNPEAVIAEIRESLVNREDINAFPQRFDVNNRHFMWLAGRGEMRLSEIAVLLTEQIGRFVPQFSFSVHPSGIPDPSWEETEKIAESFGYSPNTEGSRKTLILNLRTSRPSTIVLSLHPAGKAYRGIMAAVLMLLNSSLRAVSANDDMFQFNYKEDFEQTQKRFETWLNDGLTRALTLWREQL